MCDEKGCSKSKTCSKLKWKFYQPSAGYIKNITIDFHDGNSCYKPVLFNGCDPVSCFKFCHKKGVYTLVEDRIEASDCVSKPYVIKITGKIPCHLPNPTIEICFVSNEYEACLDEEALHNYQPLLIPNCCN